MIKRLTLIFINSQKKIFKQIMEGWIKLHRKVLEWEWYDDSNMVHLYLHLILSANHEDKIWKGDIIKRGQLITGRKSLSVKTGISERSIRTCLERLKKSKEVTIKTTNKNSLITILNYDLYQVKEKRRPAESPANDQQTTTNKNVKNIKKIINITPLQAVTQNQTNEEFLRFCKYIDSLEEVKKIEKQITIEQFQSIKQKYPKDLVGDKLEALNNWLLDPNVPKGKKNKKSLYHLMVNTWLKNGY